MVKIKASLCKYTPVILAPAWKTKENQKIRGSLMLEGPHFKQRKANKDQMSDIFSF